MEIDEENTVSTSPEQMSDDAPTVVDVPVIAPAIVPPIAPAVFLAIPRPSVPLPPRPPAFIPAGSQNGEIHNTVFKESESLEGYDFNRGVNYHELFKSMFTTGFQASSLGEAIQVVNEMLDWRLSDEAVSEDCSEEEADPVYREGIRAKVFLGFTSNLVTSGVRDVIRYLCQHRMVDVVVTEAGGIDEDLMKCLATTYKGLCQFEDWIMPIFDQLLKEQTEENVLWTPSKLIARLGKEINDESSYLYWAYKNNIPVYCPGLTDGLIGKMLCFHHERNSGLIIDVVQDIRAINGDAVHANPRKTGMIILGGGVPKHHICNANMMRNGADYSVFINTAQEFDGSDSGARPDEAVSWGKIRSSAKSVKVYCDATIVFPLLVAQTFASKIDRDTKKTTVAQTSASRIDRDVKKTNGYLFKGNDDVKESESLKGKSIKIAGNNDVMAAVHDTVFKESESLEGKSIKIQGYDFNQGVNYPELFKSMSSTGFQASTLGDAIEVVNQMLDWRLSDEGISEDCRKEEANPTYRESLRAKVFLGFTSNLVSSGVRDVIRYLCQHHMIDVVVTTTGGIEEDLIKCLAPTYKGDFSLPGGYLRSKGLNRIGNLLVPNDNYCKFEDWSMPIFDQMLKEQIDEKVLWTPSKIIARLGKEINDESSYLYWAYKNNIPVYCPGLTDGSLGDMLYFHSFRNPGLIVDIVQDIVAITGDVVHANPRKTGMIVLGGGLPKHHICNANMMRNGADYAVFVNTAQEFDGSDSGAQVRCSAKSVKVHCDASIIFPLLVAQTFASKIDRYVKKTNA